MLRRSFLHSLAAAPPACLARKAWAQQGPPVDPFKPTDEANSPVGEAKGIHPGRVVWLRDPQVASWDGVTGRWWEDRYTNERAVNKMTSRLVTELTGRKNEKAAWDALFRNFNETHKSGRSGYRPGEKIAIKLNCNQDRSKEWGVAGSRPARNGMPSPHAVVALVTQLIESAGVRGEDIVLYDVTGIRNVGDPIYRRIRGNANPQYQGVKFLAGEDYGMGGRLAPEPDTANPIRFSQAGIPAAYLPKQVTEAKYMINMALLRAHGLAGVTLIAKNHFGSVYFPENGGWSPRILHDHIARTQPMGSYNALVDLMGHQHLGGKTMLYLLDGLYSAEHNEGNVIRWASFGDQWASSMLISQDQVAIDSVGLDILRNEPRATQVRGNVDNYLHAAAKAGSAYHPDGRGGLGSLGVHEHWNNPRERKYSRNLGRKEGIELIAQA